MNEVYVAISERDLVSVMLIRAFVFVLVVAQKAQTSNLSHLFGSPTYFILRNFPTPLPCLVKLGQTCLAVMLSLMVMLFIGKKLWQSAERNQKVPYIGGFEKKY